MEEKMLDMYIRENHSILRDDHDATYSIKKYDTYFSVEFRSGSEYLYASVIETMDLIVWIWENTLGKTNE